MNNLQNITKDGIILFAKTPGITSFSSLNIIKKSLATKKVGHTGTLDSFASGLLVICAGKLTRLSSHITNFFKTYEAVIEFGKETDTLEWTGKVVKEAKLPCKEVVINAVKQHTGNLLQVPPLFSALHVSGKRASDLVRTGVDFELAARPVTVYESNVKGFLLTDDGLVKALHIECTVSKGTYIRSLSRDIGKACGSAAHLVGLRRVRVGDFRLSKAAGFSLLDDFSIQNVYEKIERLKEIENLSENEKLNVSTKINEQNDSLKDEIRKNILPMTKNLSRKCGLVSATIFSEYENDFFHGRHLSKKMFSFECGECDEVGASDANVSYSEKDICAKNEIAVFSESEEFLGMVKRGFNGKLEYVFVCENKKSERK